MKVSTQLNIQITNFLEKQLSIQGLKHPGFPLQVCKLALLALTCLGLSACDRDADVVSRNLSTDADNFKINRRVVFYNGVTGEYILQIQGLCSLGNNDTARRMSVTCRTGANEYKKHFLGLSDNVTFFAEQLDSVKASPYFYKVVFKPSVILPDVEIR